MNAFLWTVAGLAAFNTAAMLISSVLNGGLLPVSNGVRLFDAMLTAALGVWAFWLLAKQ